MTGATQLTNMSTFNGINHLFDYNNVNYGIGNSLIFDYAHINSAAHFKGELRFCGDKTTALAAGNLEALGSIGIANQTINWRPQTAAANTAITRWNHPTDTTKNFTQRYTISTGRYTFEGGSTVMFSVDNVGLGFYTTAPIAKPTVTGSRGANAALASLLTQLAALGLLTDSTTV